MSLNFKEGSSVINLSKKYQISPSEYSLLNKGLKFIPSKGSNKNIRENTRFDLQLYHRNLKLAAFFQDRPEFNKIPFTNKSTWTPDDSQLPMAIKNVIKADLEYFNSSFKIIGVKSNLSPDEIEALNNLKNNEDVIIKSADKGSSVVIMDKSQYLWEGYRQLNNTTYYRKLESPIYLSTIPLVEEILRKLKDKKFINLKQWQYLRGDGEPRCRYFYLLPKIHKAPENWSIPFQIPPGRPIVSDCSSETYQTAEYLDYFLFPLSTLHPSYLKDTYDFLEKVKNILVPTDAFLFSMDVENLYTNIDIDEGIRTIKNIFDRHPDPNRPDDELLELLHINLTRNDFQFNGAFYLQIKGTAMGKRFAPAYANIFMAEWEQKALNKAIKKPLHYYRYLDDIWGIWTYSRMEFDDFIKTLNDHDPSIQLKATLDPTSIDFLDTTTYKGMNFKDTNKLDIKVFFKPTDTHALLLRSSHHPKHTFAGLVKSQLLRFHRICTNHSDFISATKTLFSVLVTRGYSPSFLRKIKKSFLKTKPVISSQIIPMVTRYSPSAIKLMRSIKNNFTIGLGNTSLLQNYKIIAAYRKNRNLADHLIRAKIKSGSIRDGLYDSFRQHHWIHNPHNGNVFKTKMGGHIKSKNCVYLVSCSHCKIQFVGESRQALLSTLSQIKFHIQTKSQTNSTLIRHFRAHNISNFKALVIDSSPIWSDKQRKNNMKLWSVKLGAVQSGVLR